MTFLALFPNGAGALGPLQGTVFQYRDVFPAKAV